MCDKTAQKDICALSLSRRTITRRIEMISSDILHQLHAVTDEFIWFSMALDESTDVSDTAQLAIFIRGVTADLQPKEELLELYSMDDTTTGKDVFQAFMATVDKFNLDLAKCSGIVTDGAPSMVGRTNGFVGLLISWLEEKNLQTKPVFLHCIIHQENLAAKSLNMEHVMKVVKKAVNYVRTHGLKHRQFRAFLEANDCEYTDVPYYAEVRWLSRGTMLKRAYTLSQVILDFHHQQGKELHEFECQDFMTDFAFLVDIVDQMNTLNTKLQGSNQLITGLYQHVMAFIGRLDMWIEEFHNTNVSENCFPTLRTAVQEYPDSTDLAKYEALLRGLREKFHGRFNDFHKLKNDLETFTRPTSEDIQPPAYLRVELIDLQSDLTYKDLFKPGEDLTAAYKLLPPLQYQKLKRFAGRILSLFGSTYLCEQVFSRMGYTKNTYRTTMTDDHLKAVLRVATTKLEPRYTDIVEKIQCQISH